MASSQATRTEGDLLEYASSIYEALLPCLRHEPDACDAYLHTLCLSQPIQNTQLSAHCHFVALDGNQRPRVNDFTRFICRSITDFSIPRSRVIEAIQKAHDTGSTAPVDKLRDEARRLFSRLPQTGEGGEVLLSILAETFLQLPQLFTKMSLKTNTEMHVYGSDGIHVGANAQTENLAVYWGESKLHANLNSALDSCFRSIRPFLESTGGSEGRSERDLQLMRDGLDLNDLRIETAIRRYLDPDDFHFNKLEYRGLCLVGFDSDAYPTTPNSRHLDDVRSRIETSFKDIETRLEALARRENLHTFVIEVFCLPFPSVNDFRRQFRAEMGLSNE